MIEDIAIAERARRIVELWAWCQAERYGHWIANDPAWRKRLDRKYAEAYEEAMKEAGAGA